MVILAASPYGYPGSTPLWLSWQQAPLVILAARPYGYPGSTPLWLAWQLASTHVYAMHGPLCAYIQDPTNATIQHTVVSVAPI